MTATLRHDRLFIDGAWTGPGTAETIEVIDSTDERAIGAAPAATAADAERAARAARDAFTGWAATTGEERARSLEAAAEHLTGRAAELAELITRETGMPLAHSRAVQVELPIGNLREAARLARAGVADEEIGHSLVVREPAGAVACVTPWNFPLHQSIAKVAFALAAGCTVVLKPSEVAPLDAFVLAEALDRAGLPPGVFNLVTGTGPEAGEALAASPDIDMVSFTGSTAAGRRVAALGAGTVKRIALELGGKSANILLDDLDGDALDAAVLNAVRRAYGNSGQTCVALTRLLVPAARLAEIEERVTEVVRDLVVGDPFDERTDLGPLASAAQRERVQGWIRTGAGEGARLLTGGPGAPGGLDRGFYVRPTVFSGVRPGMRIAQEEIFGPVLSILAYRTEDEAVEIANGVRYGLSGAVSSADPGRAERVARRLRTGQVDVNGAPFNPRAPLGGYKESGIGREYGRYGFEEFLEIKSIQR
ncbi:aldehyde dehydrogenase family protein [Actinomadura rugatobispora]|uniref:aldehyde dehydrogenase (NAD(+)) n=1 Tax=Actinomadura rugatobispora TaxID=1994 RepID=A0ABW0ZYG6_9ACTN|nr:aldehyde dehydrogenase family protein [Actinomadura rugatobispora]